MNPERADPSYTAWDNAIVAKSKGQAVASQNAAPKQQDTATSQNARQTEKAFSAALSHANEHEHAYDPSQRGQDDESFGFWDFVDIINPLQHIPVVSTIYRDLTGDTISAPARIAGGMLYGGPLGFASAIGNAIVEETSGQDVGEIAMAMVFDDEATPEPGGAALASANAPTGAAENSNRLTQQIAATTANEAAQPAENAGSAAVTQMQSNNAALQALLKDMGLSQPSTSTASLPGSTTAPATPPQSPVGAAPSGGVAQLTSTVPTPEERPANAAGQAQNQTEAPKQHKGIPIDPSRYVNTRTPAEPKASNQAAQVAVPKSALSDPALTAAQVAQTSGIESANSGGGKDEDRAAIQSSFADRMLEGLDRYQTMTQQRNELPDLGSNATPGAI